MTACHIHLLERFQVRANLVVPILLPDVGQETLWGLLILHQCAAPRIWLETDIQLLQQLAVQLSISIQQAIAYQQVKTDLAERKRFENLLLKYQADLEERNSSLESTTEDLQCTVEELRISSEELVSQHRQLEYEQIRYENLFNFAPDGYLVTNASGRIIEANQTILNLLAIGHEAILGQLLASFIDSYHLEFFYKHLNSLLSQNKLEAAEEFTIVPLQGKPFPAEIIATKNITADSNSIQLLWIVRNISERKRAKQELLQLNQTLEAKVIERTQAIKLQSQMLEQTHDSVISTTLDGTILTWNIGAEKLYEYEQNEAIGKNVSMLYLNEDLPLLEASVFRPPLEKENHEVELRNRTKSGKIIYIGLRLSLVRDALGKPAFLIGCSNNISRV
ncbi:MAG: PAS domain S-box protein [Pseudanabaena sp. LacPavin_0818_WC45_MAG_42_6]|nr:PAS domain S-box protein [Pseudanabaena sp. LacPavin_0818_WC45_MAG_42_6]